MNYALETEDRVAAQASLAALAEQLRDGPLQELIALQLRATELSNQMGESPAERLRDLEQLVRLSLTAMEQFHSFTREFQAVLRKLTHASRDRH